MGARTTILLVTLVANVLLATVLVRNHHPSLSLPQGAIQQTTGTPVPDGSPQRSKGETGVVLSSQTTESTTANFAFRWSQLESGDYKEYIARLRAFGVPEKTIRDIIMADVGKLYRPKFAALRPPKKPANTNFWENRNNWYGPYRDMTKEQREQMKALQKEQTELIKTLLGENVYQEMSKESGYPDWTDRMFGSIPNESRDKVSEMNQRFQEAQSEIYAKAEGYIDQDTQADLKALRKKFRDELATVLSLEQIEEYELRSSDTVSQMRYELSSFEPNEEEFRAIFKYKQAKEELQPQWGFGDDDQRPSPEAMKAMQQKQRETEEALARVLTTERLKELKLMEDSTYRNLFDAGVTKESVLKVASMKAEAEKAAAKVRQDKSLTKEQQTEALKAVRAETEKTLAGLVGERRAKAYSANGGWWLRNIAPRN